MPSEPTIEQLERTVEKQYIYQNEYCDKENQLIKILNTDINENDYNSSDRQQLYTFSKGLDRSPNVGINSMSKFSKDEFSNSKSETFLFNSYTNWITQKFGTKEPYDLDEKNKLNEIVVVPKPHFLNLE